jgi:hypothetical protein
MGRCGSVQGSSYVVLGVSERLNVNVPELRGLVMLEAEFPLLCSRAWFDGACALAMAKRGVDGVVGACYRRGMSTSKAGDGCTITKPT